MSASSRTAHAFLAALERRDAAAIAPLLSDDVVELLPLNASGSTEPAAVFTGRDEVLQVQHTITDAFSEVTFGDVTATESADGSTVFVESLGRRVQADTGRVYENVYVLKFDFGAGLIRRITEYSNPVSFAQFFDRPVG